jgi:hypothetical protein
MTTLLALDVGMLTLGRGLFFGLGPTASPKLTCWMSWASTGTSAA